MKETEREREREREIEKDKEAYEGEILCVWSKSRG